MTQFDSLAREEAAPSARWSLNRTTDTESVCPNYAILFAAPAQLELSARASSPRWLERVHLHDMDEAKKLLALIEKQSHTASLHEAVIRLRVGPEPETQRARHCWFRVTGRRAEGGSAVEGTITSLERSAAELSCLSDRVHRLEAMLATVSECFKVVDRDCNLIEMNNAGLELIEADSMEQVRGVCVLELLLPEHHESFRRGMADAFEGERVVQQFEIEGLRGTRRWMEQIAVRLPGGGNESGSEFVAAFTRDITLTRNLISDLSISRQRAERASEAKSAFLANMSHEIRTPMTAILGYVDVLARPETPESLCLESIETIRRNGEHLLQVINDILDHSTIESGNMTIEMSNVSPRAIVEESVELLRVQASKKGLSLRLDCRDSVPETVRTDEVRLRQILINLIGNALKFTESGGVCVIVSAGRDGADQLLSVSVEDSGIGIPASAIADLFTPFAQADSSSSRRRGGTGLGLCISRSMAHLLGGEITVASDPGRGSVFTLLISTEGSSQSVANEPAVQRGEAPPRDRPVHGPGNLTGRRVLLVEDGVDNQRLIIHHLRNRQGADVTLAENGQESLERIREANDAGRPFELVLMDMQMPEMDGFTAARLIREGGHLVPVIALTANAMSGDRERCIDAGCDDFASKPIDFDELHELCSTWIANSRRPKAA